LDSVKDGASLKTRRKRRTSQTSMASKKSRKISIK